MTCPSTSTTSTLLVLTRFETMQPFFKVIASYVSSTDQFLLAHASSKTLSHAGYPLLILSHAGYPLLSLSLLQASALLSSPLGRGSSSSTHAEGHHPGLFSQVVIVMNIFKSPRQRLDKSWTTSTSGRFPCPKARFRGSSTLPNTLRSGVSGRIPSWVQMQPDSQALKTHHLQLQVKTHLHLQLQTKEGSRATQAAP